MVETEVILHGLALAGVVLGTILDVCWREQRHLETSARPRRTASQRCPYCHLTLPQDDLRLMSCVSCATLHHADCWSEHGACSVFGCELARRPSGEGTPDEEGDLDQDPAQEEELEAPQPEQIPQLASAAGVDG